MMRRYDNDLIGLQDAVDRVRKAISPLVPPLDAGIDLVNEMRWLNSTRDPVVQASDGWHKRQLKSVKKHVQRHLLWQEVLFNQRVVDLNRRLLMGAGNGATLKPGLLFVVPYDIADHTTGGASRLYGLARHLARDFAVRLITLVSSQRDPEMLPLYPGVDLFCVPRTEAFDARVDAMRAVVGDAAALLAMEEGFRDLPLLSFWTAQLATQSAAVIIDGPALLPLWQSLAIDRPLVFESPNVYPRLLRILGPASDEQARRAEAAGLRLQAAICEACAFAMTVTDEDARTMIEQTGMNPGKCIVVRNGVECARSLFFPPAEAQRAKRLGGIDRTLVLFLGSNHLPNLEAVAYVRDRLLPGHPAIHVAVVGMSAELFERSKGPLGAHGNITFTGKVSEAEKESLFALADVAICPIECGSGSSLKVPDYAAHGKPVVSTPFGLRGFDQLRPYVRESDLDSFGASLQGVLDDLKRAPEAWQERCRKAREEVERTLDWSVLASSLRARLTSVLPGDSA